MEAPRAMLFSNSPTAALTTSTAHVADDTPAMVSSMPAAFPGTSTSVCVSPALLLNGAIWQDVVSPRCADRTRREKTAVLPWFDAPSNTTMCRGAQGRAEALAASLCALLDG